MRRTPRTIAIPLCGMMVMVLPVLLTGDRADAFSYFQLGGTTIVWTGSQSVRYLSPTTFPIGSQTETLILEAMGLWNIVPGANFVYSYINAAQDFPIDNFDGFSDTAAVPASTLDPGVLGVTYLVNNGTEWFDMDVLFSDLPNGVGYTLDPNPDCNVITAPTPTNGYSFLLVGVHEMGHALGLGHEPIGNEPPGTPWFVATMNGRYPSGGTIGQQNIIELHADDRNGARFLYPNSGPSNPPVVDLASAGYSTSSILGQVVPVACTPAALGPGEELTCRSVIENFGITNEFFVRQGFYLSVDGVIETTDTFLGELRWDIATGDAFEFDVAIDMPADIAAGTYYVGSIFDDLDEVAEDFEDNNAVSYCQPVAVNQLAPEINALGQEIISCEQPYTGPTPTVTFPLDMAPITWSLDNPPSGMTVDPGTGVISWQSPVRSPFLYTIFVRATNAAGTTTQILFLGVDAAPPVIDPIPEETAACNVPYAGPSPIVSSPDCMNPIINWSIDQAPAGMTIDNSTGQVSWLNPLPSVNPYTVEVRATNTVGNGTVIWQLQVPTGDFNGDGSTDVNDIGPFVDCLSGPGVAANSGCECADADQDNDVDLRDFSSFQKS